jgi:hypothetical protein
MFTAGIRSRGIRSRHLRPRFARVLLPVALIAGVTGCGFVSQYSGGSAPLPSRAAAGRSAAGSASAGAVQGGTSPTARSRRTRSARPATAHRPRSARHRSRSASAHEHHQAKPSNPVSLARCESTLRPGRSGPAWIIPPGAISRLARNGLPWSLVESFDRPSTLLLENSYRPYSLAPHATPALYFTSAAELEQALAGHTVPSAVHYLVLDLEQWSLTPMGEQRSPIASLRTALAAARAASKCVVFTPAVDLIASMNANGKEPVRIVNFDRLIAGPAATLDDVFEVQSQQTEGTQYATVFAREALRTTLATRPGAEVFAGLSTNPDGRHVTAGDLLQLYKSAHAAGATGYWLNIPKADAECPLCGTPQTGVAVAFLKTLARTGWAG